MLQNSADNRVRLQPPLDGRFLRVSPGFRKLRGGFYGADTQVVVSWNPKCRIPTVEEGKEKLEFLTKHGATPQAFTFQESFDPAGNPIKGGSSQGEV